MANEKPEEYGYDPTETYLRRERLELEKDMPGIRYFPDVLLESELGSRLHGLARLKNNIDAYQQVFLTQCEELIGRSCRYMEEYGQQLVAIKKVGHIFRNYVRLQGRFAEAWNRLIDLTNQEAATYPEPEFETDEINVLITRIDNLAQRLFLQVANLRVAQEEFNREFVALHESRGQKAELEKTQNNLSNKERGD